MLFKTLGYEVLITLHMLILSVVCSLNTHLETITVLNGARRH